jgi:hypothetical protein
MNSLLVLAYRLSPVLLLLACAGGGGGGNNSGVNDNLTAVNVYDYQTPVSKNQPVLQAAAYPVNWDGTSTVTPPKVSEAKSVYADGTIVIRDGSVQKPFLQSELVALATPITDPNAVVRSISSSTTASALTSGVAVGNLSPASNSSQYHATDYDLRWATPDPSGPGYALRYMNSSWQPTDPVYFWGQKLTGCEIILTGNKCTSSLGPSIAKPAQEVIDAWSLGWTGLGVNILMEDFLNDTQKFHGTITSLIAYRYAPGSNLYGLDINVNQPLPFIVTQGNTRYQGATLKLGVVNASYVAPLQVLTKKSSGWTDQELLKARLDYTTSALLITNRFQNASYQGQVNYTDAVITKAAGNDKLRSDQEPINKALADIPAINSRLLIVGALTQAGSTGLPVDIASYYSNTAGNDAAVSSRYLLASGTVPFETGGLVVNGTTVQANSNVGTSYAAPRVAGMVAIVRSKFPNLNASQTASIMLDTARYDTLTCYKTAAGCDPAIYGKGEASLSRALAPVGKLR